VYQKGKIAMLVFRGQRQNFQSRGAISSGEMSDSPIISKEIDLQFGSPR
jgi:hypothetical protein